MTIEAAIRGARRRRGRSDPTADLGNLRRTLDSLEGEVAGLRSEIARDRQDMERLRAALSHAFELLILRLNDGNRLAMKSPSTGDNLPGSGLVPMRRSRSEIAASVSAFLTDPELARLTDPEIAERLGIARQTVTNWRRRLHGEAGRARHRPKGAARDA